MFNVELKYRAAYGKYGACHVATWKGCTFTSNPTGVTVFNQDGDGRFFPHTSIVYMNFEKVTDAEI